MIAHIANLVRWEWFKTQRRQMPWILLIIPLLFTQLGHWGTYFSYRAPIDVDRGIGMAGAGPVQVAGEGGETIQMVSVDLDCEDVLEGKVPSPLPAQMVSSVENLRIQCQESLDREMQDRRDMLDRITLPGSVPNALDLTHGFGVILIAILTASMLGSEFGLGTLRMILAKGTGRWQLLSAKLVLMALLAGAALAIVAVATAISSLAVTTLVEERPEEPMAWAEVATAFGRTWFSLLPYVLLAGLVSVVASSSIVGITAAIGYLFTEVIVVAVLLSNSDWAQNVADYMLGRNITAWMMGSGREGLEIIVGTSTPVGEFPGMSHAFLVLLGYMVVFAGLLFWNFQRKDIGGASGA